MPLRCCQLVRKGRHVAAEPHFEGGELISLAHAREHAGNVGQLAIVSAPRNVGRVVEVLGHESDIRAVLRGLLAERGAFGDAPAPGRGLDEPPVEVERELDAFGDEVPFADTREDLRTQLCVTIDPPDAKDHDDAIALEGDRVVWVHIADVSAYVTSGSALDQHALDRGVSVYVPGAVAPMLPHRLSSDLCSLRPGVDRGCVSVRLELDADGAVTSVRFARTLIRSARRLSYDQVDEVLAGRATVDPAIDDLLARIDALTAQLRERRMRRGALDMQLPEVVFDLGERAPNGARLEPESPSHRLVEECMLLANEAVGRRLAQAQQPGIWRLHAEPEPENVLRLLDTYARLGVPTPPAPEELSPRAAARLAVEAARMAQRYSRQSGRGASTFLPLLLRSLQQATYAPHTGRHSGLAVDDYAHFTSPIRRYPDLVNHRSLLRLLGVADDEPSLVDTAVVADHVSTVEREAAIVERTGDDIVRAHLLHRMLYESDDDLTLYAPDDGVWHGEVTSVISSGAFVRFGAVFEGYLPARALARDERHYLDEAGLALVGNTSGERIGIGDTIDVIVNRINRAAGKVDLRRASGGGFGLMRGEGAERERRRPRADEDAAARRGSRGRSPRRPGGGRRAGRGGRR